MLADLLSNKGTELPDLVVTRLGVEWLACTEDGGVEEPWTESRVEEDLLGGTVSLELFEFEDSSAGLSIFELCFLRRSSLKKGIENY